MTSHQSKLDELRVRMKKENLDAYIIPNADQWQSEHPDACDERLKYISGLDASAGYAVITMDKACVMIDGRYTLSAKEQVDTSLFDIVYYTDIHPEDWAIENIKDRGAIGYDPWIHPRKDAKRMQKTCNEYGVYLTPVAKNLVDMIWDNQPAPTAQTAIALDLKFAGRTVDEKLNDVALALKTNETDSTIITAADSLAWLLNLRTIENTRDPGIKGFAIFESEKQRLTVFTDVDCSAFDASQTKNFEVDFLPILEFAMAIHYFETVEQVVQIADTAPDWLTEHLNAPASIIITKPDPCEVLKAIKNQTEQDGIRAAHHRDAAAVKTIINNIKKSKYTTEIEIDLEIHKERSKCNSFRGVSFDSIVGWNANGAKIHGKPTDTAIKEDGLLLIDSGGQYDDGTTDITRTLAVGTPTDEMKKHYTLVLKAHIALATAVFPKGTTGVQLDSLARAALWRHGLDYAHGTGHGVGCFLNVHEGPCGISPRNTEPLKAGMLLSNEPGYYREDHYGIRLENLMLVQPCDEFSNDDRQWLCFETVTKVPFDEDAILRDMLSTAELEWLDQYQAESA